MNPIPYVLSQPTWFLLLIFLGLVSLTKFSLFLLTSIYKYLLRPSKNLLRYGQWAIVTGPTSGIGQSLAFELAKTGMNLVLVGRNPNKLEQVASAAFALRPSIEIKTVVFDLSTGDIANGIEQLREAINGKDVGLLVNNAGLAEPRAIYLHEANIEAWMKIVRVNLMAVAEITHAVLPSMLARKKGAIVNIGSGSAMVIPSYPLYATYAATKAFVTQFSESLYNEYTSKGIDIQCQLPSYVATKMTIGVVKKKNRSWFTPDSDIYARAALQCIGYDRVSMPCLPHFVQWCFVSLIPDFLVNQHILRANLKHTEMINRCKSDKTCNFAANG